MQINYPDRITTLNENRMKVKTRNGAMMKRADRTLKKDQDKQFTRNIGKSMRFFLNLSFALIIAFPVLVVCDPHPVTSIGVILYLIPVATTIIFFIAFLRLLKQIERYAARNRNIELVSRTIWEMNRSSLIRLTMGKIQAFIEEE